MAISMYEQDNGAHLQAHGAGVIQVNGTFYLIGEDKTGGSAFQNVNCYSSADLVQWHYEGALLSRTSTAGDLGPNRVIERPKVIYNDQTKKYVLWMHVDSSNYGEAKVGVATGDAVCGKYTYLRSFRPLSFQSRDMGLFKDDDGTAYLLSEDRQNGLRIIQLTDDYLDVRTSTYLWPDRIEAPALLKHRGRYYMFGSHLSGWDPNDNVVSSSASLRTGWTAWATFADKGSKTYASQTNYVLAYNGNNNNNNDTTPVYMGDRWVSSNLMSSTYVWLPLQIDGTRVTMKNRAAWNPRDPDPDPAETAYTATSGTFGGRARTVSCSACVGGQAAGYIGGPDKGSITVSGIRGGGEPTTLIIHYSVSEAKGRMGSVAVNGGRPVPVQFLPGTGSSSTGNSVVTVALRPGTNNTVEIGGAGAAGSSWGPDVDRILVPN